MDRCDLHLHTKYSFDSKESLNKYCIKAINDGIKVICFTDHIEASYDKNTFNTFKFKKRIKEINRLKNKYKDRLTVLNGYEIGEPHLCHDVVNYIDKLGCDMIIGSVHRPFRDNVNTVKCCSKEEYLDAYYKEILEMVKDHSFDCLGHLDFCKKIAKDKYEERMDVYHKILDLCIENNIPLDVNTSSLRVGFSEPYPSYKLLEYYRDHGGKYITINSDAHEVCNLGKDYYTVLNKIPKGLKLCYFQNRELKEI